MSSRGDDPERYSFRSRASSNETRQQSPEAASWKSASYFPFIPPKSTQGLGVEMHPDTISRSRLSSQSGQSTVQTAMKIPPSRSTSITDPCVVCGTTTAKTYTCVQCNNDSFCSDCWAKERPHRPGAVGIDGKPHEKTDRRVVERLRQILEPKRTPEQQQRQHRNDEDTTWFGIARDSANMPIFQDYERYSKIMASSRTTGIKVRFPQLVSFIGQTGAGKSTLVKMLIDHQDSAAEERPTGTSKFPSPVTGSINDNIPTSGDVHLYSDPATYISDKPILYADCEGLDGGENIPRGARFKIRDDAAPPASRSHSSHNDPNFRKKLRKATHSTQRDLAWANSPETRKREYAVTQLYPRLLYTFSDVVVFVLRNPKTFESIVLEKLLEWASASIEKSLNQPTLPHVIIALNATENNIDEKQWDTQEATKILMSDIEGAISRVPKFREHALIWQQRGTTIRTTRDLLECYYSSVTVVRIPTHGRYMLIDEQIGKLDTAIRMCCSQAYLRKKRVHMLSNAEKLEVYLQSAYDHFSQNLNVPFDFVTEAMKNNPIPRDFSGNILKLAIAVRDHSSFGKNGWKIFQELSRLVASCVMLDCARQELLGSRVQLFDDVYDSMCFEALETFCNQYSPCSFSNRFGTCSNFKSGHNPKGHQNSGGKIIAAGEYQSTFDVDIHGELWIDEIRQSLASLQDRVHNKSDGRSLSELEATGVVHEEIMCDLYQNLGPVYKFVSHSTCFSCLRELPEHPLPCGHVLCSPCINAYGQKTSKTDIQLNYCPLHRWDTAYFPWKIRIKPLHAGTRILSLDGGGVRGIVELEVLKAIETALGGELPIQAFFDLIVGTSTGGIIALGLGVQNWTVDQCIEKFTDLCKNAFMPRRLKNIPILGKLEMANHRSIYRTKPFEDCLQECFEDRPLFGGLGSQEGYMVKVAVTSTTLLDQHAIVFGNYNRPETHEYSSYCFERHDKPLLEMKTWEAARATSAAPPYFKTFIKNETKCGYLDGALYHNNPVTVAHHERKAIWQDVNRQQPDIFLSLGTGHNGHSKSEATATSSIFRKKGQNADAPPEASHISLKRYHTFTGQLWSTVSSRFDSILNCNRIWDNFRMDVMGAYSPERRRYIRLNPDLRFKVPALDDIAQLSNLQKATKKAVVQPSVSAKIREVAHRLLASTFFFEKIEASTKQSKYGFECKGLICCRFQNGSIEMKALGQELRRCWIGDFEPYFMVQEDRRLETIQKVPIARHVLEEMILRGRFSTDRIHIIVSNQLSSTTISLCLQESCYPASADANLPISGFPRTLMAEDVPQKLPHRSARSSGSFTKRPHRRRRNTPRKTTSSSDQADGDSSAPTSLRRVKSQSNLRRNPDEAPTAPENPAGFGEWMMKRRKSTDWTELPGGARENVFEMPDTSLYRASSG